METMETKRGEEVCYCLNRKWQQQLDRAVGLAEVWAGFDHFGVKVMSN